MAHNHRDIIPRLLKGNTSEERRDDVKKMIINKVALVCTKDVTNCPFSECKHLSKCGKDNYYTFENLPSKNRQLEKLNKKVEKAYREKTGRVHPLHRPDGAYNIVSYIIGIDVCEHELVKDCEATKIRIRKAKTVRAIVKILDQRHLLKTGKIMHPKY